MLTEERDVARSHEEELFAKLTDRTEDLEALQESYVSLTDRCDELDFLFVGICSVFGASDSNYM